MELPLYNEAMILLRAALVALQCRRQSDTLPSSRWSALHRPLFRFKGLTEVLRQTSSVKEFKTLVNNASKTMGCTQRLVQNPRHATGEMCLCLVAEGIAEPTSAIPQRLLQFLTTHICWHPLWQLNFMDCHHPLALRAARVPGRSRSAHRCCPKQSASSNPCWRCQG